MTTLPATAPADLFERIRFGGQPVARAESIVMSGEARFTVLTARTLRMEWAADRRFEDRSSYAFPTRQAPTLAYTATTADGCLTIDTGALRLRYQLDSDRFSAGNLSISYQIGAEQRTWMPGMPNTNNLRGTRRTLDGCNGDAALEEGLLSRDGWSFFDDSRSVVFGKDDGWVTGRMPGERQDWYFFGYGHDYKGALAEYARFGGAAPLIPRYVLGAWWSRYWAYSEQELRDLVADFRRYKFPLDVMVIDMDWHTPQAWTGYTWNRGLFPDPPAFLAWLHEQGLHVTLNLHPAQGVQSFEEIYAQFAQAMGLDPAEQRAVPFALTNKDFARHYFELIHHPMEDDGVDFWWMDWQQGDLCELEGLDPLIWINHVHFQDSARRGRRPMLYSRWGGLGNHRYPIGFSGDTYAGWPALQFQPYMTAVASNVLFGWWSHDIGGHMGGATPPELYARWVQYGALSPCLRLHATKDARCERRPWAYLPEVQEAALQAFRLRYSLLPYLYTMARVTYEQALGLCRPMYYEHPEADAAYVARYQYYLGDQIIAAPLVHPADPANGIAATDVWVPEGAWIDYQTHETFNGPAWFRLVGDLFRVPMLVRAGGIIPLAPQASNTDRIPRDRLIVEVFPGEGAFRLYEDDGSTEEYRTGSYVWTPMRTWLTGEHAWVFEIGADEGTCRAVSAARAYEVRLVGSARPSRVFLDGRESAGWSYDEAALTTTVSVPTRPRDQPLVVTALAEGRPIVALGAGHNRRLALEDVRRLLGERAPASLAGIDDVLSMPASTPGRADAIARLGGPGIRVIEYATPEEAACQLGRVIVVGPQSQELYDLDVTFTYYGPAGPEQHHVHAPTVTGSRLVNSPFSVPSAPETARWEAAVSVTWREQRLEHLFRSAPLRPSIACWHVFAYDAAQSTFAHEDLLDAAGRPRDLAAWYVLEQRAESLSVPYLVLGKREERPAGEAPVAWVAACIISPDKRDVSLQLSAYQPGANLRSGIYQQSRVYLNGEPVTARPVDVAVERHTFRFGAATAERVHLRAGENWLVATPDPAFHGQHWHFGATFLGPDSYPMPDLRLA